MPISTPEKSKDLQPSTALWRLRRPDKAPHRFDATDATSARAWQTRTRLALAQRIGLSKIPAASPRARVIDEVDMRLQLRARVGGVRRDV